MKILDYENGMCGNCGKDRECVLLETEAYTALHCAKCLMAEARKRKKPKPKIAEAPQFEQRAS